MCAMSLTTTWIFPECYKKGFDNLRNLIRNRSEFRIILAQNLRIDDSKRRRHSKLKAFNLRTLSLVSLTVLTKASNEISNLLTCRFLFPATIERKPSRVPRYHSCFASNNILECLRRALDRVFLLAYSTKTPVFCFKNKETIVDVLHPLHDFIID